MRIEREPDAQTGEAGGHRAIVLTGLGVSPGVAIGPAHVVERAIGAVPEYGIGPGAITAELARLDESIARSVRQLRKLQARAAALPGAASEEVVLLLEAHLAILAGSRLTRGAERRVRDQRINAEAAVEAEIRAVAEHFQAIGDPYLAGRIQDVRDVGGRLIRNLTAVKYRAFSNLVPGTLIIADEITPADTAMMEPGLIGGFAAVAGGAEGHTAIMARALGLPAVLGVQGLKGVVRSGERVVVDGLNGRVVVDPDDEMLDFYGRLGAEFEHGRLRLRRMIGLSAETRDGVAIRLMANIELPQEAATAASLGADGVGLLRTEFLFMNRERLPGEEEQYQALATVIDAMGGRPVTIRTLDVGGEKLTRSLADRFGRAANPALGIRAVRLSLREPKLLGTQLAAILRAACHGPVRILLPMVSTLREVRLVRKALGRAAHRLVRRGLPVPDVIPPIGVMIETPAAALIAPALAREVEFFALGTNDLVQYTLAVDRADDLVADLYDPLHPAVLRLIALSTAAAREAGIGISACGEVAGDPRMTALLVGLGIDELSMSPGSLLTVKERVRMLSGHAARELAAAVLAEPEPERIAALIDAANAAAREAVADGVGLSVSSAKT